MPLRLAYFSPLPPSRTGIADYSRALLTPLASRAEITCFVADPTSVASNLLTDVPIQPHAAYPDRRRHFDATLYQMGNSAHHAALYQMALRYPGLVVLHDVGLHHFVEHQTVGSGRPGGYTRALAYAHGRAGLALADDIRTGRLASPWFDLPLNERLLDRALALVAHSHYALTHMQRARPALPFFHLPALIESYPALTPQRPSHWPADAVVFASAGQVTRTKHVDRALRAFARLRRQRDDVRYLIIGEPLAEEVDLPALLAELNLVDAVHTTGFVPDLATFNAWIAGADVLVNLRHPTVGETSATALRGLAAGRPLIVYDAGWYAELPETTALKVAPGDDEALLAAMVALAAAPARRQAMGADGRALVTETHAPTAVADQLVHIIQRFLTQLGQSLDG